MDYANDEKKHENEYASLTYGKGINHLTTDNDMLEVLIKAQEHDELLQKFKIGYVDETFTTMDYVSQKNCIFLLRQESTLLKRNMDSQEFMAEIHVIITLKQYDVITAQKILKTMYKDIMFHLSNNEIFDYMEVLNFHFEYTEPTILTRGVITFQAREIEDFCFEFDPCPVRVALGIRTSIQGQNERVKKIKTKEIHYGK